MRVILERCAGIDVGKRFITVCAMVGAADKEPQVQKRMFGTFNSDLETMRQWLADKGCSHVVMESTGSYWKPIFNILVG